MNYFKHQQLIQIWNTSNLFQGLWIHVDVLISKTVSICLKILSNFGAFREGLTNVNISTKYSVIPVNYIYPIANSMIILTFLMGGQKKKKKKENTKQVAGSIQTPDSYSYELSKLLSPKRLYGCHPKSCHSCQRWQPKHCSQDNPNLSHDNFLTTHWQPCVLWH